VKAELQARAAGHDDAAAPAGGGDALHASPRMVAQRVRIDRLFWPVAQREAQDIRLASEDVQEEIAHEDSAQEDEAQEDEAQEHERQEDGKQDAWTTARAAAQDAPVQSVLQRVRGNAGGRGRTTNRSRRTYGNSNKLARHRYALAPKRYSFKDWKRGREAQHLIPAAVCREFRISADWVDDSVNGMMLPSGRKTTNHLRDTRLDKGKRHHIKTGWAHPRYNSMVTRVARRIGWRAGQVSWSQFMGLAMRLRGVNRPSRTGPASGHIDDIQDREV
jgi:hypothetical protein